MAIIGERLRGLLKESGLQQKEAASLLNMKVTTFSGYVNDYREADIDVLIAIADFFGVSLDYLTGRTDERSTPIRGFIKENIDIIRGNMTYAELSADIGIKLNNPSYSSLFTPKCLEDIANAELIPTSQHIKYLAQYTGVNKEFFYCKNTVEDLINAQDEFVKTMEYKMIEHMDQKLNQFVMDPDNNEYVVLASEIKEKGTDIEALKEFIVSEDESIKYARLLKRIKEKGIDPDIINGFTLKNVKI